MLTALTGVVLVLTEDAFSFLDLWILIGFAGILSSPLIQMTVAERARQRLTTAMAENSNDNPPLRAAAPAVYRFLTDRFAGKPVSGNC